MSKFRITDLLIYRWRYIIGYATIGILLVSSLAFAGILVPGGLTTQEMASVVTTDSININSFELIAVPDLPYHLLQLLSINLLGVSALSVKLPSLLLGLLTAVGLIFLLRRWFSYNVAVLAAIIAITTSQFLFLAQNGTPLIMHLFWPVWLLLSATMIARHSSPVLLWRFVFFILAALSLYTPLSIYGLIAIAVAVILHPRLRYLFWRVPAGDIAFSAIVSGLLLVPLIYQIAINPAVGLNLLGLTSDVDIASNALMVAGQLFNFGNAAIAPSGMMLPVLSLGSMLLVILGVVSAIRNRHSVRTYLITAWVLLMLPVTIIQPDYLTASLLPVIFLLAGGLSFLFEYWYKLFPRNPYARVAGLIPLIVLVGGLVASGLDRYSYGYTYSQSAAETFSKDISIVNQEIKSTDEPLVLFVGEDQRDFYKSVTDRSGDNVSVTASLPNDAPGKVIVAGSVHRSAPDGKELSEILTNSRSQDADRFYVYRNPRT